MKALSRLLSALSVLALCLGCSAPDTDAGDSPDGDDGSPVCTEGCETGIQLSPEQARRVCETSETGPRTLRRLTSFEVRATLQDIFPELGAAWNTKLSVDISSKLGFSNDSATLVVGGSTAKEMLKTAEDVGDLITANGVFSTILPCADASADAACATEFINARGLRLFRRPLTDEEVSRYVTYQQSVADRADFATGIKWATVALVQSPHAFYRRELGDQDGSTYKLSQYELATELGYVYSGSTPDADLLAAAAAGELATPEQLRAQATRLSTSHPRRLEPMSSFFFQWLQYGKVRGQSRVKEPTFAESISLKMLDETNLFLNTVVYGDNGGVRQLMTANYTALDPALSTFYGFGDVTEGGFARVERPANQGVGILAQGSMLAATSHQEATSPTLRGLLFYTRFLCNSRPKPPDIVPPIEEARGVTEAKTTRQKFEEHHARGTCASCHKPFEPFGFTMEQFDETGRYRAMEITPGGDQPINTVATVTLNDGSTPVLTSLDDVSNLVDSNDDIENCMSGLLAAYAFSGAGGQYCLAEPERKKLASGELSIREFLIELTQAPHFSSRR